MSVTINGSGTIGGLTAGGLPDGTVTAADLASTLDLTGKTVTLPAGVGGKVLQVMQAYKTNTYTTTSTSLLDVPGLSITLTPRDANSKFLIFVNLTYINSFYVGHIALLRGDTELGMADAAGSRPRNFMVYSHETNGQGDGPYFRESMNFLDSPATVSAVTYKIQASARRDGQGGTFYINRTVPDRDTTGYDPRATSSIVVMEIAP